MANELVGTNTSSGFVSTGSWSLSGIAWQAGDAAVCYWHGASEANAITPPATVTQKYNVIDPGVGNRGRLFIGYRRLVAGDSEFTWTSTQGASGALWGIDVIRDGGDGDPFSDVSGSPALYNNVSTVDAPSVTPTYGDALIYTIVTATTGTQSIAAPGDYSLITYLRFVRRFANAYKVVSGGAGEVQSPGTWDLSQNEFGFVWTGAISRLVQMTSGCSAAGFYHHYENPTPLPKTATPIPKASLPKYDFKKARQFQEDRLRLARNTILNDEELATLLISILSYDDDVL